jgi:hypothetical protein
MAREVFTHVGWFGICPVYLGALGSDCPHVTPRWDNWAGAFLFGVSHYGFLAFFAVADALVPKWQPGFPIAVTGELLIPFHYETDE